MDYKTLILLSSFLVALNSCTKSSFVKYRPHNLSSDKEHKKLGESELDSASCANTIQVLAFYGHDYKLEGGNVILIPEELSKNWGLLWNYTTKANDKNGSALTPLND